MIKRNTHSKPAPRVVNTGMYLKIDLVFVNLLSSLLKLKILLIIIYPYTRMATNLSMDTGNLSLAKLYIALAYSCISN